MPTAKATHDITITDTDSTVVGFLCPRDKDGNIQYAEKMYDPLNLMQVTGYADESSEDPRSRYPVGFMNTWVGGYGQEWFNSSKSSRYYESFGCDLSEEGKIKLGPDWTAVAYPTISTWTLINADLDDFTGDDPDNWTVAENGGGTVTEETTTVHTGGGSSAHLTVGAAAGAYARITQQIYSSIPADLKGRRIQVKAWCYDVLGTSTRQVRVYDGITYTPTTPSGTGAWEQITINKTIASNATELTIVAEVVSPSGASGSEMYVDDITLDGYVKGNMVALAEYGGSVYAASGDILLKESGGAFTLADNYVTDITNIHTATINAGGTLTSYLMVMVGGGTKGWYWNGTTSVQMTGTAADGTVDNNIGTTQYIADGNVVRSSGTDARTDNWSSDIVFGAVEDDITDLIVASSKLFVIKANGIYYLATDGSTVVEAAPQLRQFTDTTNGGKNGCEWGGKVYVPMGTALIEYDPENNVWENISPTIPSHTSFDGVIRAVSGGKNYLWVAQRDATYDTLFKGQYAQVDGVYQWNWHPVARNAVNDVQGLMSSSLSGTEYVWWGGVSTSNSGYYDTSKYEHTGEAKYVTTPWFTGGMRHITKALYEAIVGLDTVSANLTVTLAFEKYGTGSYTNLGTITTSTNGEGSKYFPANSYCTAVRMKITLTSTANTTTPVVNYLKVEGKIRPSEVPVIDCVVQLIDRQKQLNGVSDGLLASRKETCIDNVLASNWPVTMVDLSGTSNSVDVLQREQVRVWRDHLHNTCSEVHILAHKVTLS